MMFETLSKWWWTDKTQKYAALIVLMLVAFLIRHSLSLVLFATIFGYLGVSGGRTIHKYTRLPYIAAVISFFVTLIAVFALIVSLIAPMFYKQGLYLYEAIVKGLVKYPQIEQLASSYMSKFNITGKVGDLVQTILRGSLSTLSEIFHATSEVVLALFLAFIFAMTFKSIRRFGNQFLSSDFPGFFKHSYLLLSKFAYILGQIFEVQIVIDVFNTTIMLIGFMIIGMPSPVVLGMLVFILGLVPVAGVLISMVPLTILAFSTGGLVMAVEVLLFVLLVHTFEAYFLHPKLMASRSELPIFVTFTTLIFMETFLGAWGLIVGVPLVSFFLDVLGVHRFSGQTETFED